MPHGWLDWCVDHAGATHACCLCLGGNSEARLTRTCTAGRRTWPRGCWGVSSTTPAECAPTCRPLVRCCRVAGRRRPPLAVASVRPATSQTLDSVAPTPAGPPGLRSSLPATAALGRCQPLPPPSAAPGHGPVPLSLARMSGVARSAGKKAIYAADAFIPKGSLTQSRFNLLREIAIGSVLGISAGLVWKVRGDGEALGCRAACWGPRTPCSAAPGVFRLLDRPWAGGPASTSSGAHGARSARRQWRNRARRCDALPGRGRRRATPRTAPGPGSGLKHA